MCLSNSGITHHFHTGGECFHADGSRLSGALVMLAGQFNGNVEGISPAIEHPGRGERVDEAPLALEVLDGDDHGSAPEREISGEATWADCVIRPSLQRLGTCRRALNQSGLKSPITAFGPSPR